MSDGFVLWTMWLMLLGSLGYALYSASNQDEEEASAE
jgi:hypothetical protein